MKYARHRGHREALYRVYMQRGTPGNLAVLERMIARRHELATLLGYRTWADYATEDKMIKTAERAAEFIGRVTDLTAQRMEREVAELREQARQERPVPAPTSCATGTATTTPSSCRRRRFDVRRTAGAALLRLRARARRRARRGQPALRPDDQQAGRSGLAPRRRDLRPERGGPAGGALLPRHAPAADKFKHAAMFDLVSGVDGQRLPEAALVCNLPRPAGDDPGPARARPR
jgi:thimet oligopeptidase